jgi:hypothetical protein
VIAEGLQLVLLGVLVGWYAALLYGFWRCHSALRQLWDRIEELDRRSTAGLSPVVPPEAGVLHIGTARPKDRGARACDGPIGEPEL